MHLNFLEDSYVSVYPDMLSLMEEESPVYSNYRKLIEQKPKGIIQIEFTIGSKLTNFEVEYELDLFHQRSKAINYDEEIDLIFKKEPEEIMGATEFAAIYCEKI